MPECLDALLVRGIALESLQLPFVELNHADTEACLGAIIARHNLLNCWKKSDYNEGAERVSASWCRPLGSDGDRWIHQGIDVSSSELLTFGPFEAPKADAENANMMTVWVHFPFTSVSRFQCSMDIC